MSSNVSNPPDFYTLEVNQEGGGNFAVRGWSDKSVISVHNTQREAHAAAARLNLEGHATAPVEIPEPLLYAAAMRAKIDGMSMEDWIRSSLDDRLRMEELNDRFMERVAKGANRRSLGEILALAATTHPTPATSLNPSRPPPAA